MYLDFQNSPYNLPYSRSEYDSICIYLDAEKHKVSAVANEIVESIFSMNAFDNINADVWALISKRVGFPVQNKSDYADETKYIKELEHRLNMIDDDAAKFRTFIIDKGISSYFLDAKDELFGFVYLDNIDVACDLDSDECLSWKRYKITQ
jgi:hypothetical protein